MKLKNVSKKLTLQKITVTNLEKIDQAGVRGGLGWTQGVRTIPCRTYEYPDCGVYIPTHDPTCMCTLPEC